MLSESQIFDVLRQALWIAIEISTPVLATALAVGLAIGLFQALTTIQEMTLTFVPKLSAMLAVFYISFGFMNQKLVDFFQNTIVNSMVGF